MARGISRFADRGLRYGWKYDEKTRKITNAIQIDSPVNQQQIIELPRGNFRIWLSGAGGGCCGYIGGVTLYENTDIQMVTNEHTYTGQYHFSAGGNPSCCAFDVHIPNSLTQVSINIGKGGIKRAMSSTASSSMSAGSGGTTSVTISSLNITATAGGGTGGTASPSTAIVVTGTGCAISGASFVQNIKYHKGAPLNRTSWNFYDDADDWAYSWDGESYDINLNPDLKPPLIRYGGYGMPTLWYGEKQLSNGDWKFAGIPSINKPTISGYSVPDYAWVGGYIEDGDDGYVIIERL